MSCIYVSAHMSWGVPKGQARHDARRQSLARAKSVLNGQGQGRFAGVWIRAAWDEFSETKGVLSFMQSLEAETLPYVLTLKDRNFGSCKYNPPVPASMSSFPTVCSNGVSGLELWNPKVWDALFAKLGRIKNAIVKLNLQGLREIHFGESAYWPVSNKSEQQRRDYYTNFIAFHKKAAVLFAPLGIKIAAIVNWSEGQEHMDKLCAALLEGGVKLSCPDTPPGMFKDNTSDLQLPKAHGLVTMEALYMQDPDKYKGRFSPHMESYDMRPQDYDESFELIGARLGPSRVLMSSVLSSRRHGAFLNEYQLLDDESVA